MAIKKGYLVKVIEVDIIDAESYGIIKGETYKVIAETDNGVSINAGRGDRFMFHYQIEKVEKKKSKKDLKIEELENTIEQIQNILNKFKPF